MTTLSQKTIASYNKIAKHYNKTHYGKNFWQKEFKNILKQCGFGITKFRIVKEGDINWLCYFVRKN